MTEQWLQLKATIKELRDNGGTGTQQEVCKFLVNLMDNLEKEGKEPIILDKIRAEVEALDYDIDYIDYDCGDMPCTAEIHTICREEVFEIIDKYRK